MYIKSFHIEGFGPLSNVHVEDIPCAMTVFLGNNEAGKSSAMEFVRAMLMGVPTKRNYTTQAIRNSLGGSMKIHDMHHGDLEIIRHFSQSVGQVQILDAMGASLKGDILGKIFSGVSRDVYRMIYGFNLLELQNISNFHGSEVFNSILGASFGLGLQGPVAALEKIQERMDLIYKPRGKNTRLQKLFDAWTNNKEEIDQALEEVKQYDLFQEKQSLLEKKLASLRAEKNDIVRHGNEVQRFIGMWGQWNKWAQLQAHLEQLPSATINFPENAELVLERILEQEKIKQKNLLTLQEKQSELEERQKAFDVNESLVQQQEIVQKLLEQKGTYKQALMDNTAYCVKEEQFLHVVENAQKRLVEKWLQLDPFHEKISTASCNELATIIDEMQSEDASRQRNDLENRQNLSDNTTHHDIFMSEFVQEFAIYEARILDAQAHAQSARTAIDYAKRDVESYDVKKAVLEKEIHALMEVERKEQANNMEKLDAFSPLSSQIDLTKEAIRVIPEKLQRTLSTLDSWKRQLDSLGIRELNSSLDDPEMLQERLEDLREQGKFFQLLNDGDEKDLYLHGSDIVKEMIAFRPQITESAKKITDEREIIKNIEQKIERLDTQIADLTDDIGITKKDPLNHNTTENREHKEDIVKNSLKEKEKQTQDLKESLDVKSRALQKLQTINELRSQGIRDFNGMNQETKDAQNNLAEKKTSALALLPGIFCFLLGAPLLILRLLSGENFIVFDKIQSIISFATLFPAWTGTLYVPIWLPSILIFIAIISLYLPLSRKSDIELDQNRFDVLQRKLRGTVENLDALRKEEMSILSCAFDIKEVRQGKLFEAVRSSYVEEDELVALYEKENLSYIDFIGTNGTASNLTASHLMGDTATAQSATEGNAQLNKDLKRANKNSTALEIDLSTDETKGKLTGHTTGNERAKTSHAQSMARAGEKMSALFVKVQKRVQGLLKEHDLQKKHDQVSVFQEDDQALSIETAGLSLDNPHLLPSSATQTAQITQEAQDKKSDFSSDTFTPIAVEIMEEQKVYNPQYLHKILEENLLYREVAQFVHEELQMIWEKEYAFLIAEEQRNDIKAQNHAKNLELLKEKKALEDKLAQAKTAFNVFLEEWQMFFEQHFFTNIPEAQFIEAFFFRIAAAESLQKRLQELNTEVHAYNEHIRALRETVEKEYIELFKELQKLAQAHANTEEEQGAKAIQNSQHARVQTNVSTQDMLLALEKHIQDKRLELLSNKDISVKEVALDDVVQAQQKSREHLELVQQNLIERQALVDEEFMECVNFLYKKGILSAKFVKECQSTSSASQLAKEFENLKNAYISGNKQNIPSNNVQNHEQNVDPKAQNKSETTEQESSIFSITSDLSKKPFLSNVKQVMEIMKRFLDSMTEYTHIKQDTLATREFIDIFESSILSVMEETGFQPVYSANEDFLEAFDQIHRRVEQEKTKNKEVERILENSSHVQADIQSVQEDLQEIRSNLNELLKLAQVDDESSLRVLIESQKQREQLVRSSLDLEEPFRAVVLPKYVAKAQKPHKRAFDWTGSSQEEEESYDTLPEIFAYFEENAQNRWQMQLEEITENYERVESQEQEIQNTCGALQAKCDALIESASLATLKRAQVNIEEEIKEVYEKWLELSLSKEIIMKAQEQYEQEKQPQVISMASDFFATITDNAWQKIVVSMDNKEIKVMGEKGSLVNPELLSQGAKEQLYLSLRLAHIKSRAQTNQTIPILMDDILVNFDTKRAENTIKTFSKLMTDMPNNLELNPVKQGVGQDKAKLRVSKKENKETGNEIAVPIKQGGQQILFYTCHEHTARLLADTMENTKIYLVENKMVRPA